MSKINWRGIPTWLLRAWPIWAVLPFIGAHALMHAYLQAQPETINKWFGAALQLCGGLIVLYSVNDNLGLFKRQSIIGAVVGWAKSFPMKREVTIHAGTAVAHASMSGQLSVATAAAASTIEQRVDALEKTVRELNEENRKEHNKIHATVERHRAEIDSRIGQTDERINTIGSRLEHAAVGGFKPQVLGVILAIYGSFTSAFA